MEIGLKTFIHAANDVGAVNKKVKKHSKNHDFFKDFLMSLTILISGVIFFSIILSIGMVLMAISFVIFFVSLRHKNRFYRTLEMRKELRTSPSLDEKVQDIFTDLDSSNESNRQGFLDENENIMILTEKRVIFMHVPRVTFSDIIKGDVLSSVGTSIAYDGLKKKVEEEIKQNGIRSMIKKYAAYTMNYDEISKIKVSPFLGCSTFIYRGAKFKYSLRRDQMEQFRQAFANYIRA